MKRICFAILFCALATSINWAQDIPCHRAKHTKIPPLREITSHQVREITYHQARKRLIAAGWKPVRTKTFDEADSDSDIANGNGRIFWEKGYVEVERCYVELAYCSFLFKDEYGNLLRVTASGVELPQKKIYAKATGFGLVCEWQGKELSLAYPLPDNSLNRNGNSAAFIRKIEGLVH